MLAKAGKIDILLQSGNIYNSDGMGEFVMLTPIDFDNKAFKSTLNGYHKDEVDDFISLAKSEFERLYRENIALNDKINMLTEAIKEYKNMEAALQNTIVTANNIAEEVKRTAQLNAESLVKEAENKAKEVLLQAQKEMTEIRGKHEAMIQDYSAYKAKIRSIVEAQMRVLEELE